MTPQPPPAIAEVFANIMEGLRKVIAARAVKAPLMIPVFVVLWNGLGRFARRFEALVARFEAGRLRPPRAPRPARPGRSRPPPDPAAAAPVRLPGRYRWVIAAVPGSINFAGQLRHYLSQPQMADFMATPQAARLLRPLFHMLGIEPGPDLPATLFRRPRVPKAKATPPAAPPGPEASPRTNGSAEADAAKRKAWRDAARVARRLGRSPSRAEGRRDILPGYVLKPA